MRSMEARWIGEPIKNPYYGFKIFLSSIVLLFLEIILKLLPRVSKLLNNKALWRLSFEIFFHSFHKACVGLAGNISQALIVNVILLFSKSQTIAISQEIVWVIGLLRGALYISRCIEVVLRLDCTQSKMSSVWTNNLALPFKNNT